MGPLARLLGSTEPGLGGSHRNIAGCDQRPLGTQTESSAHLPTSGPSCCLSKWMDPALCRLSGLP